MSRNFRKRYDVSLPVNLTQHVKPYIPNRCSTPSCDLLSTPRLTIFVFFPTNYGPSRHIDKRFLLFHAAHSPHEQWRPSSAVYLRPYDARGPVSRIFRGPKNLGENYQNIYRALNPAASNVDDPRVVRRCRVAYFVCGNKSK